MSAHRIEGNIESMLETFNKYFDKLLADNQKNINELTQELLKEIGVKPNEELVNNVKKTLLKLQEADTKTNLLAENAYTDLTDNKFPKIFEDIAIPSINIDEYDILFHQANDLHNASINQLIQEKPGDISTLQAAKEKQFTAHILDAALNIANIEPDHQYKDALVNYYHQYNKIYIERIEQTITNKQHAMEELKTIAQDSTLGTHHYSDNDKPSDKFQALITKIVKAGTEGPPKNNYTLDNLKERAEQYKKISDSPDKKSPKTF